MPQAVKHVAICAWLRTYCCDWEKYEAARKTRGAEHSHHEAGGPVRRSKLSVCRMVEELLMNAKSTREHSRMWASG